MSLPNALLQLLLTLFWAFCGKMTSTIIEWRERHQEEGVYRPGVVTAFKASPNAADVYIHYHDFFE